MNIKLNEELFNAIIDKNSSPEFLREVIETNGDNYYSCWAIRNENCPIDIIENTLKGYKDNNMSRCAVLNPNCPEYLLINILNLNRYDLLSHYASINDKVKYKRSNWLKNVKKDK
jgi:hypothetical protein